MSKKLLITDFDGVVCDSVEECLLVTYNAYHRLQDASFQRLLDLQQIAPETRQTFRRLRPYLKGAEDFLPLFRAVEQQIPIATQREFDAFRDGMHNELSEFVTFFYAERDFLIRNEHRIWLSLNPLYGDFATILRARNGFERVHILTTKRREDVLEIFGYQQVAFPPEQISYIKAAGKSERLLELLREYDADPADMLYFEDQVDFLVAAKPHGIQTYLVEWGYVSDEQRDVARQHDISLIAMPQFAAFLSEIE